VSEPDAIEVRTAQERQSICIEDLSFSAWKPVRVSASDM
jgi:hypothetical protein